MPDRATVEKIVDILTEKTENCGIEWEATGEKTPAWQTTKGTSQIHSEHGRGPDIRAGRRTALHRAEARRQREDVQGTGQQDSQEGTGEEGQGVPGDPGQSPELPGRAGLRPQREHSRAEGRGLDLQGGTSLTVPLP